jgi:hypothetical protein
VLLDGVAVWLGLVVCVGV